MKEFGFRRRSAIRELPHGERQRTLGRRDGESVWLLPLPQDAAQVALSMQHGDHLKRHHRRSVHDGVIRKSCQSPKAQMSVGEVGSRVAMHGSVGDKCASLVDRLLNPVGCVFIVLRDKSPNGEDVGLGLRREDEGAHLAVERQTSFIA